MIRLEDVSRSFQVGEGIDASRIEAEFNDGVHRLLEQLRAFALPAG